MHRGDTEVHTVTGMTGEAPGTGEGIESTAPSRRRHDEVVRNWLARLDDRGMLSGAPQPAGVQSHPAADVAASDDAKAEDDAARGVTGVWEGMSQGPRAAMRYITLTMVQQGNDVTGYYRCAYGTQLCRNMEETGVIKDGKMIGRRLMMRVMLRDGSTCYFTGVPQATSCGAYTSVTMAQAARADVFAPSEVTSPSRTRQTASETIQSWSDTSIPCPTP
jgi:hypothetical protein